MFQLDILSVVLRSRSVAVVFRVEGAFPFSSGLCFVFRVRSHSVAGCVSC